MGYVLDAARIEEATRSIDPALQNTPLSRSERIDELLKCRVLIKDETANPIRSFKGRGTENFISAYAKRVNEFVCASAGNFGQGMAWAARRHDARVTVFAAEMANPRKIARIRELGARVELVGSDFEEANAAALNYATVNGSMYVDDTIHPEVAEGAGTIALELTTSQQDFDVVVVPIGGGALINGIGTWIRHAKPESRVIGVCAQGAPSMALSWQQHKVVETGATTTVADGIALRIPSSTSLEAMRQTVDDVVLVSDDAMMQGMRLLFNNLGVISEPAGAAALAAIIEHGERLAAKTACVIVSGGNLTERQMNEWLLAPALNDN